MKKTLVLLILLSTISWSTVFAALPAKPLCGRVIWRSNPATPRSDYRYDVLVNCKILHWTAPKKYNIGARICV